VVSSVSLSVVKSSPIGGDGSVGAVSDASRQAAAGDTPVVDVAADEAGDEVPSGGFETGFAPADDSKLPIKMLNDRILVGFESPEGERKSSGGILIPATAQMGKRLAWARVVAVGPNVRQMEPGDRVLFNPEDRYEVEVRGNDYIILRERDIHAVAAERLSEGSTGLYL
jgi:chaperonin GroES